VNVLTRDNNQEQQQSAKRIKQEVHEDDVRRCKKARPSIGATQLELLESGDFRESPAIEGERSERIVIEID
jgi:hypothetical protein